MKMTIKTKQTKSAILFPGQGSNVRGMVDSLITAYPESRNRLKTFSEITGVDLYDLHCQKSLSSDPVTVHLAMVSFGLLFWEWLTLVCRLKPAMVAGHSMGEITALACAGVISSEDALILAKERGLLIEKACRENPGGMKALIGSPVAKTQLWVRQWLKTSPYTEQVFEANINSPEQLVVSGKVEALDVLEKEITDFGTEVVSLRVAGAFHSPYMNSAVSEFLKIAKKTKFRPSKIPVISSMTANVITNIRGLPTHLSLQMVRPVQWLRVMSFLRKAGIQSIIEAGPGVLCQLASDCKDWEVETASASEHLK